MNKRVSYPKEWLNYSQKAKDYAITAKDEFSKINRCIRESLTELKFKGIEFTRMTIEYSFPTGVMDNPGVFISIWTSALSGEFKKEITDSMHIHLIPFRGGYPALFEQIECWKEQLVTNHQNLLKSMPLFK